MEHCMSKFESHAGCILLKNESIEKAYSLTFLMDAVSYVSTSSMTLGMSSKACFGSNMMSWCIELMDFAPFSLDTRSCADFVPTKNVLSPFT